MEDDADAKRLFQETMDQILAKVAKKAEDKRRQKEAKKKEKMLDLERQREAAVQVQRNAAAAKAAFDVVKKIYDGVQAKAEAAEKKEDEITATLSQLSKISETSSDESDSETGEIKRPAASTGEKNQIILD